MDELRFLLSPIGVFLCSIMIAIILFVVRLTRASTLEQRTVYATLLASAKKAALLPTTVVIPLKRRADSLEALFLHLSTQQYASLEVLVVVYQTAGSRAQGDIRRMGRRYGLTVKTVRHSKGRQIDSYAATRGTGDIVMQLTADTMLSPRFFEYCSFAFTQDVDAVRIRRFTRLDATLRTSFAALWTLLSELRAHAFHRHDERRGLPEAVAVRRAALSKKSPYIVQAMLFDDFAMSHSRLASLPTVRSAILAATLAAIAAILVVATPLDILAYVMTLAFAVLFVSLGLFIVQHVGYRTAQKSALLLIAPFSPLAGIVWVAWASLVVGYRAIKKLLVSLRPTPRQQRLQQEHTQ